MGLLNDLIDSLDTDATVRDIRVCVRATAVLSDHLGLAYTFPRIHKGHSAESGRKKERLIDRSARQLAELALSEDSIRASVGIAAINSLLDPSRLNCSDGKAFDLIVNHGQGKNVTVVGHFPFVDKLRERVAKLSVLELAPQDDDLPASEAKNVIPNSDVVAITGTSFINHTIEPLLELAKDSYVVVLGPSTPMSPVLFDHGVNAICGSIVEDQSEALACISEGVGFRYVEGLRAVNVVQSAEA